MLIWQLSEEAHQLVDELVDRAARCELKAQVARSRWGRAGYGSVTDHHDYTGRAIAYQWVIARITGWSAHDVEQKILAHMVAWAQQGETDRVMKEGAA